MQIINNTAIILAGGTGSRMKNKTPKQFLLLNKKKIFEYSLNILLENKNIHQIILVCHKDWINKINLKHKNIKIVPGGNNRTESVLLGLKNCSTDCKKVVIHDAARPFISKIIINKGLSYLNRYQAAVPFIEIKDSIIETNKSIKYLKRNNLKIIQTPQFFLYNNIFNAYKNNQSIFTDDLSLVLNFKQNISYKLFTGSENNFKITTMYDYKLAKKMLI